MFKGTLPYQFLFGKSNGCFSEYFPNPQVIFAQSAQLSPKNKGLVKFDKEYYIKLEYLMKREKWLAKQKKM